MQKSSVLICASGASLFLLAACSASPKHLDLPGFDAGIHWDAGSSNVAGSGAGSSAGNNSVAGAGGAGSGAGSMGMSGNGGSGAGVGGAGGTGAGTGGAGGTGAGAGGTGAGTGGAGGTHGGTDAGVDAGHDAAIVMNDDGGNMSMPDGGTGSWPSPPATMELKDVPKNLGMALCSALSQCLKPTLYEVAYLGMACPASAQAQLEDGEYVYLQASIDAGRVTFDKTALTDCYTDIAAQKCSVLSSRAPARCNDALHGNVANGGACVIDNDCVTGSYCDRGTTCPGMCKTQLASGATCDHSEQCATGLLCADSKCQAPAATSAACEGGVSPPCKLDALCVGSDSTMSKAGSCVDQTAALSLNAGQACDPGAGKWCKDGLSCIVDVQTVGGQSTVVEVCRARVASGGACNFAIAPDECPEGQYCPVDLNTAYQGTCAAKPGDGKACGPYDTCAAGEYCKSSVCHAIGRIGDVCAADSECASANCNGTKCAAPVRCRLDHVASCGDNHCDTGEDCKSCAADCGACAPKCGDGTCNGTETCTSCIGDCGACAPKCGDGTCNGTETCTSCVGDCGACLPKCGDHTCDPGEDCKSCASDCGACPAPYSGPCTINADCGAGKKCVTASVSPFPLVPPVDYGYCAESCSVATNCSGTTAQRVCTAGSCGLRCNPILGVLDATYRCPTGMTCANTTCSWAQ